ncbi:hypothetical protein ACQ4PT_071978 [Festuca glaucescens]
MAAMLKVYADRLSQPSRALIIFCRVNKLDFEEVTVNVGKGQHRTPEFKKINPMGQVPAIVDGRFRLFESHAILRYLATVFPGVPDHWYPVDLFTRAKVESILDWHHSNLRHGAGEKKLYLIHRWRVLLGYYWSSCGVIIQHGSHVNSAYVFWA